MRDKLRTWLGEDPTANSIALSGIKNLVAALLASLLGVVVQLFLARQLGGVAFGHYALAMAWAAGLSILAKLGLDSTSLRVIPSELALHKLAELQGFKQFSTRAVLYSSLILGLCGWGVISVNDESLDPAGADALQNAMLLLPVLAILEITGAQLQALKRSVAYQLAYGSLRPAIVIVAFLLLAWLTAPAARTAIWANIVGAAAALVVCVFLLKQYWPTEGSDTRPCSRYSDWTSLAIPLWLISGFQFMLSRADVLVVGAYAEPVDVGAYAVANQLAMLVTFGIGATNAIVAPTVAELYAKRDFAELARALAASQRVVLGYTVPVMLALVILGKPLLSVFHSEYSVAYGPLLMLAGGQFVVAWCGPVGFLLTMTAHHKEALIIIGAAAIAQIALLFVLVPELGLWGAALSGAIASTARSGCLTLLVRRRLGVRVAWR